VRLISTASNAWQADCSLAAEKGEPFYVLNLKPDEIDFLCALIFKFPLHRVWGVDSFFFNPPPGAALEGLKQSNCAPTTSSMRSPPAV